MTGANALHEALASLSPTDKSNLPSDSELKPFLLDAFKNASILVDAIPEPPAPSGASLGRSRSNTATSTGSAQSAVTASLARSGPPSSERAAFQKEWKEVKPGGPNPYDIKVYKLSAKDGNGAWFARRSVHEGIGYRKFRKGLRREFEEGLKAREDLEQKKIDGTLNESSANPSGMMLKPGVRGIGCERNMDRKVIKGVGRMDVYHLSAQFPGPTTPRDFVTLCLTTAAQHPPHTTTSTNACTEVKPREFTMVSRPFNHPDLPVPEGFVRGRYESVEFIREVVPEGQKPPSRSASVDNLNMKSSNPLNVESTGRKRASTTGQNFPSALGGTGGRARGMSVGNKGKVHNGSHLKMSTSAADLQESSENEDIAQQEIPFANENDTILEGDDPDDNDDQDHEYDERESNPVEWIMLTRSDPGGSVPRWMVERGTPGSIVADAEKFLNWAFAKEHDDNPSDDEHEEDGKGPMLKIDAPEDENSNASASQTDGASDMVSTATEEEDETGDDDESIMSFQTATSGRLSDDGSDSNEPLEQLLTTNGTLNSSSTPTKPGHSRTDSLVTLSRFEDESSKLNERLVKQRHVDEEKQSKELQKEAERQRKLEEKHARDAAKREEKFKREQEKAEGKRRKEEEKIAERKRKLEEKDVTLKLQREKERLEGENGILRKEKDLLVRDLEAARREIEVMKANAGSGMVTPVAGNGTPLVSVGITPRASAEHLDKTLSQTIRSGSVRRSRSQTIDSASSGGHTNAIKKVLEKVKDKVLDRDGVEEGQSLEGGEVAPVAPV